MIRDDGLGDWRIRAVSRLAREFISQEGHVYKAGSLATLTTATKEGKRQVLSFTTPSPPALALSIAIRAVRRAKELRKRLVFTVKVESPPIVHDKPELQKHITNDAALYDFFEECMVTVVFSFQALETFSNTIIAEKLKHIYHLKRRKKILKLSAEDLQREAYIEEKLGTILPKILSTKTPRGEKVWQDFKDLKGVRDTTIHMKAFDANSGINIDKETFFYRLLNVEVEEFPRNAIGIIAFFFKDDQLPRWLISARDKLTRT